MNHSQPEKQPLTPLQKQSILVCAACALAVLLTVGITWTLLRRGKQPSVTPETPSSSTEPSGGGMAEHYQIDEASAALLTKTSDAGESYLNETLFLGDSNTVRMYNNGLISLQQFCAKEGIGLQAALNEEIVTFKKDDNRYTLAQAVAKMKPRRVVITLGTNDNGMAVDEFIGHYTALVKAIQSSYPYTDIIINSIPPIPEDHSAYPNMDQAKIDDFNVALLEMCEEMDLKFLNSAEALLDETGYGQADYYTGGDIHLKSAGLKAVMNYLRTHAYTTEDRRPDTNNIPTRTLEYSSNPSSAVEAPSSSDTQEPAALYEVRYQVEKKTGGTLTCGSDSGKTSLSYDVTGADQSFTVTAVPDEGYVFVKWSDGVTSKTRTDSKFKQNLDVTAMFATASVHITSEGKAFLGTFYTFKATVQSKYAQSNSLRWYANGEEVKDAAGQTKVTFTIDSSMLGETFHVYATISYNDCDVRSNTLVITVGDGVSSSGSGSSSSSDSGSSSSGSGSGSSSENVSSSKPAGSESGSSSSGNAGSGSASSDAASSSKDSGSSQSSSDSSGSASSSKNSGSSQSSSGSTSSDSASSSKDSDGSQSSSASSDAASSSKDSGSSQSSGSSSAPASSTAAPAGSADHLPSEEPDAGR